MKPPRRPMLAVALLVAASGCSPVRADDFDAGGVKLPPDLTEWKDSADAETLRVLEGYARTRRYESADLDGDGRLDIIVTRDPDTTVRWRSQPSGASAAWVLEQRPDQTRVLSLDVEADGFFELVRTEVPVAGTLTTTRDTNQNQRYDWRRREARTPAGDFDVVEENDPLENGQWQETRRFVVPAVLGQGSGSACVGLSDYFPGWSPVPQFGSSEDLAASTSIHFVDGAPAACDPARRGKLKAAYACAIGRFRKCLTHANAIMASALDSTLASGSLYVGCNNPCSEANTVGRVLLNPPKTNWGPQLLDALTPNEACGVALHELLHWAGVPSDPGHDQGLDATYACGRYCGNCMHHGPGSSGTSSNVDCARCAGTSAEKARCGVEQKPQSVPCPARDICTGALMGNKHCLSCQGIKDYDCSGAPLDRAPTYECCEVGGCPTGYKNNEECVGTAATNTCSAKPPEC